ncbi:MAG: ribosomal protein L7/L12 [Sphingobacteriaceae bacterium]|nr:ribosomal protein L7/L12 [Sphingobacteriaceae bacterium]
MINVSPEIQQQALLFLYRNQKIAAVKVVKDHSGCGLKEAKDYVDALEAGTQQPAPKSQNLDEEVLAILSQGNKLNAIKHYKDATGLGLAASRDYVEKLMQYKVGGNIIQQSRDTDIKNIISGNYSNNQNSLSKKLIKILLILLIVTVLAYLIFKI